jgi:RNA polymerase sigma-70 factor (ECF subfamily)
MEMETDEAIALRVQRGDMDAFGLLVERYEEKLARYARRFLLEHFDAQDIIQEVFLKAYVNLQSFDPARRFSPWIYRIAHNEFINALKKKSREAISLFDPDTIFPTLIAREQAEDPYLRKETKAMIEKGLAELSPKYREPVILYYFEEMDYREIADVLHIPVATVGVRLKRARDMLRKTLNEQEHG